MESGAGRTTVNTPAASAPERILQSKSDNLAIVTMLLVVILLAGALIWPWLPQDSGQSAASDYYHPLDHAQATTRVTLNSDGTPVSWTTDNVVAVPAWHIFSDDFPALLREQILANLPELGNSGRFPHGTTLFHNRSHIVNADGSGADSESYLLRRPERDQILAVIFQGIDTPLIYDPPLELTVGEYASAQREQSGVFGGIYTYTVATTQSQVDDATTPFGAWRDCRQVDVDFALYSNTDRIGQELTTSVFCPARGSVFQTSIDIVGNTLSTYTLLDLASTDTISIGALLPPPRPLLPPVPVSPPSEEWLLTRFAQTRSSNATSTHNIAPVYVAASHPFLLVATRGGPLRALDSQQPEIELWRFQSAGSIHTSPAIDPTTGYLYFGSSDKHLYSLSADGLFLWRIPTHDNIAAQPVIHQSIVVAAAEDGTVYALDKLTGAEHWRQALGSATIASPTHFATARGDLIITGSDSGSVNAVDAQSGTVIWETPLDGAIQAPLRVEGNTLFVGTTAPALHALDEHGSLLWRANLLAAPRTAPTFDGEHLYLVDSQGWLYAVARADGRLVWRSNQSGYLGPPIRPSSTDNLLVASVDGAISLFSPSGALLHRWQVAHIDANGVSTAHTFSLGPTFGGGALWLTDDRATLFRLGPPMTLP